MTPRTLTTGLLAFCFFLPPSSRGQGTRSDYERANALWRRTEGTVFKARVVPHWDAEGSRFWYRNDLPGGEREFIRVDAVRGVREPAFDHKKLAAVLAKATGKEVRPTRLPIDRLDFGAEAGFRLEVGERWWHCDPKTYELKETTPPRPVPLAPRGRGVRGEGPGRRPRRDRGPQHSEVSPDGRWTAFVKDHNLFLRAREGERREFALTKDGKKDDGYTGEFHWSPDSRWLAALRRKDHEPRKIHLIESSPRDQLQPKLHSLDYRKPGDPIPTTKPRLFDVEKRQEVPVSDELFANPWDIHDVRWDRDSKRFTFLYNQRGHQVLRVVGVDKAGKVKNQVTRGQWVVRGVERVDAVKRQVWFRAGGIRPGQDPYFIHHCRVNFDGSGLVVLTEGDGTHEVAFSPGGRFFLDTWSRVDLPPVTELRRADDGRLVCALERADISALKATGWKTPEPFVAKGRDGKTDIFGVIFRPTNFDASRKYPVVEHIYAGPHDSFVPKAFRRHFQHQSLAELGFVVVQIDGMGTSNRSKAFHDVCWKNLGDSGFPDRIAWVKAAAKKYPYLDLDRIGIYGGSAGGQSALRALLAHGDFYKVAVADCGCHDNRMDKVWWNELWMGWPVGPHYAEQSNVTNAHKLKGKLLLIVGELDRNVDPASTMQVVDALVRADKDFDLLVIPGAGHGAAETPYGHRRRQDFLVRHLLGVEPRERP